MSRIDKIAVSVFAALLATIALSQTETVLGELKRLSRIWDGTDVLLISAGGAALVDGSAVTQPISAASLPLPTGAATAANQDGIVKDGAGDTTQANVSSGRVHVDGSGVTQPVSGTVTANAGTDLNTSALALDATLTNRMPAGSTPGDNESNAITASRYPSWMYIFDGSTWDRWTGAVSGTVGISSFPDNEPFNLAQIAGTAASVNNGATDAGTQRVTLSNDSTGEVRIADDAGNQIPSSTAAPLLAARGLNVRRVSPDPCGNEKATPFNVNLASATTTLVATGVASQHVYICAVNVMVGAAQGLAFIAGTGATCGTSTAGMNGGTTGATGWQMAANGGIVLPAAGFSHMSTEISGGATGDSVCIVTSTAAQTSGTISYVIEVP